MTTKTQAEHTATPWHYEADNHGEGVIDGDGITIAVCKRYVEHEAESEANAAFIVRACNSHDALVEALQAVQQAGYSTAARVRVASLVDAALRLTQGQE